MLVCVVWEEDFQAPEIQVVKTSCLGGLNCFMIQAPCFLRLKTFPLDLYASNASPHGKKKKRGIFSFSASSGYFQGGTDAPISQTSCLSVHQGDSHFIILIESNRGWE